MLGITDLFFDNRPATRSIPFSRRLPRQEKVGGVTASTELLAAKRHARVHTPVIECKTIIANQNMAYAA